MKNLLKRFAVMIASVMLVMTTFAMPSFAAGAPMTIGGVEYIEKTVNNQTVKTEVVGYQIISKSDANNEWLPNEDYLEKAKKTVDGKEVDIWKVKGTNIEYPIPSPSNTTAPSGEALQALAKIAEGKTKTIDFTYQSASKTFVNTDDVKGSFLVLVKNNASTETYNPMLVSRDDRADGGGTVTAQVGDGTAYAKKSEVPFEKVVDRRAPHNEGTNDPNNNVTGDGITGNDAASPVDADPAQGPDGNRGDTAGSTTSGVTTISYDPQTGVTTDGNTIYDDVWFRINTKVPEYADNYFNESFDVRPQFIVYDTLSTGLTFNDVLGDGDNLGMWVDVNGTKIFATNTDVKITKKPSDGAYAGKTFVVEFTEAGLKKYGGKNVEICYSAKLNKDHGVNFNGETNTASLEYTRNPGEAPKKGEDKTTYHYTFEINGHVDAKSKLENREVIKIGLDDNGNQVLRETVSKSETGWTPLAGVKFELRDKAGNVVKYVITDANGVLRGMEKIDAGEYDLVETKLPAEYSKYKINSNPIPVSIVAKLDSVGRLEAYTVKVNNIVVGNYKKDYSTTPNKIQFLSEDGKTVVSEMNCDNGTITPVTNAGNLVRHEFNIGKTTWTDTDTEAADIINSQSGTLPSTGGMGTILFTVGGIVIMGLALLLLFGGKRRQHQK